MEYHINDIVLLRNRKLFILDRYSNNRNCEYFFGRYLIDNTDSLAFVKHSNYDTDILRKVIIKENIQCSSCGDNLNNIDPYKHESELFCLNCWIDHIQNLQDEYEEILTKKHLYNWGKI